ncbi:MAG: PP2C family protein-serine/threonine phosphatase [Vicinamibacterales bacterium]
MTRFWFRPASLRELMRELPPRALAPLAVAIFVLFAVMGPVVDLFDGARQPISSLILNSALSGLVALGYAFGSLRRKYWLVVMTFVFQIVWLKGLTPVAYTTAPAATPAHLTIDGVLILAEIFASYASFLMFMNGTAARYLRVRAEIALAQQIHKVLVPPIASRAREFELFGFSMPSGAVGGDLVDVVDEGQTWFGYVADVSGHGVSSGVVMGMFKSALRMRLRQGGPLPALLADLNDVLLPLKSSSMYVTLSCVRGSVDGRLEYAVAGHLPLLHIRANAAPCVEELTTPQIPIGMFADFSYTSAQLQCERGDLVALITDGLTEVFDRQDREFGLERVKDVLKASAGRPLAEIADRIVSAARAHGRQLDDQTLLLIRRGPV